MSVKRERISTLFDHRGIQVRGAVSFVRSFRFGESLSAGHQRRGHASQQLQRVAKGADVELRTLCRRGIIPS